MVKILSYEYMLAPETNRQVQAWRHGSTLLSRLVGAISRRITMTKERRDFGTTTRRVNQKIGDQLAERNFCALLDKGLASSGWP